MNADSSLLVLLLTVVIQFILGVALESRSLTRASHLVALQGGLLALVYVVYGVNIHNPYLFVWAGVVFVLLALALPYLPGGLLFSAHHMPEVARVSPMGTLLYGVFVALAVPIVGSWTDLTLVISNPLVGNAPTVSLQFVVSLCLCVYGLIVLLTHRHPFKMVIGLMMMMEGSHLILVQLAPQLPGVVKIGILTQTVPSIFMVLWVNRLIAERIAVTDTASLSDLRY